VASASLAGRLPLAGLGVEGGVGVGVARRFDIRRKFFHFEFFQLGTDYVPIEINCRPPGGAIIDMMNYSIDGDLYRAWVHMLLGRPLDLPEDKRYCVAYVGRKDTPHALGHDELVARIGPRLVEHADNPPLFWDVMGHRRYIYRSPDEGDTRTFHSSLKRSPLR